jgi:hypothetical protein
VTADQVSSPIRTRMVVAGRACDLRDFIDAFRAQGAIAHATSDAKRVGGSAIGELNTQRPTRMCAETQRKPRARCATQLSQTSSRPRDLATQAPRATRLESLDWWPKMLPMSRAMRRIASSSREGVSTRNELLVNGIDSGSVKARSDTLEFSRA